MGTKIHPISCVTKSHHQQQQGEKGGSENELVEVCSVLENSCKVDEDNNNKNFALTAGTPDVIIINKWKIMEENNPLLERHRHIEMQQVDSDVSDSASDVMLTSSKQTDYDEESLSDEISTMETAFDNTQLEVVEDRTLVSTDITGKVTPVPNATHTPTGGIIRVTPLPSPVQCRLTEDSIITNSSSDDLKSTPDGRAVNNNPEEEENDATTEAQEDDSAENNDVDPTENNDDETSLEGEAAPTDGLTAQEESGDKKGEDSGEVFVGSLGLDVDFGTWELEIDTKVDIRMGRDEWETTMPQMGGDVWREGWETSVCEIADSLVVAEDWQTHIPQLEGQGVLPREKDTWTTTFYEGLRNEAGEWPTQFNKVDTKDKAEDKWTTQFNKIEDCRDAETKRNEWTTKFCDIEKGGSAKSRWITKIPNKFKAALDATKDWKTRINKCRDRGENDRWAFTYYNTDLSGMDRTTWMTAFKDIIPRAEVLGERWETTIYDIEPAAEVLDNTWTFDWRDKINDLREATDWNTAFIDIEKNENPELDWTLTMNDVPEDLRDPADWQITEYTIEPVPPELNPWSFAEHLIVGREEGENPDQWTNEFIDTDVTDMSRETWVTDFFDINNTRNEDDWELEVKEIENEDEIDDAIDE